MAGNYFHDPRPFYGLNHHNLISMDELFYGRKEPPPWYMHQMPQARFDDQPRSRSVEPNRRPEQYIQREEQFREYRRPDMRDDIYMDHQYAMQQRPNNGQQHGQQQGQQHGQQYGQQQKNQHQGGNNNTNKGKHQQKHGNDSDEDDNHRSGHQGNHNNSNSNNNHHHGNKSNPNHGNNKSHNNEHSHHNMGGSHWSDNKGFHGGRGYGRHRRSLSLTQTVLKKLGLRDDTSSSESSDDDRSRKSNKKGGHGHGHGHVQQMIADHKPYTVRFDDQFYGHGHGYSNQSKGGGGSEKFGEDHGSYGNKKGGGQSQGILKTSKHKNGHDGYSSDDENHKNHGNGKGGNQHHGGAEAGKKNNGQAATKQLGRSQSMDFRVNLCCDNCERKVKKSLRKMDVDQVYCDQWNNRVVVVGNAKPENVLKKLRAVKEDTYLWHPQHK